MIAIHIIDTTNVTGYQLSHPFLRQSGIVMKKIAWIGSIMIQITSLHELLGISNGDFAEKP